MYEPDARGARSAHVFNVIHKVLANVQCLHDFELLRVDEDCRFSVSARRIPDSTTAGDLSSAISVADLDDARRSAIYAVGC
jgi:hypothetical protein